MKICYIDEAGDGRRPGRQEADVPLAFVICGLVVDSSNLPALTGDHLAVKARFRPPAAGSQALDDILTEIKGGDLRGNIRKSNRVDQSLLFLDAVMDLLERHDVGLLGRVWIKNPLEDSDEKAIYTLLGSKHRPSSATPSVSFGQLRPHHLRQSLFQAERRCGAFGFHAEIPKGRRCASQHR